MPLQDNNEGAFVDPSVNQENDSTDIGDNQESESIPEKFRGKSTKDIANAYNQLEQLYGRQAQELGELRRMADDFIKSQLKTKDNDSSSKSSSIDEGKLNEVLANTRRLETLMALEKVHPDYVEVLKDPEFADWIQGSKARTKMFLAADQNYDFDMADELLTSWKEKKKIVRTREVENSQEAKRENQFRTAKVDTGGGSSSSKKVYRRSDLIRLRATNPEKYNSMIDEIHSAYQEGRVR